MRSSTRPNAGPKDGVADHRTTRGQPELTTRRDAAFPSSSAHHRESYPIKPPPEALPRVRPEVIGPPSVRSNLPRTPSRTPYGVCNQISQPRSNRYPQAHLLSKTSLPGSVFVRRYHQPGLCRHYGAGSTDERFSRPHYQALHPAGGCMHSPIPTRSARIKVTANISRRDR